MNGSSIVRPNPRRLRVVFVATEAPWPVRGGLSTKLASLLEHSPFEVDLLVPEPGQSPLENVRVHEIVRGRPGVVPRHLGSLARGLLPSQAGLRAGAVASQILALVGDASNCYVHFDTIATAHLAGVTRTQLVAAGKRSLMVASVNDSYSFLYSEANQGKSSLRRTLGAKYIQMNERKYLADADYVDVVGAADLGWYARIAPSLRVRIMPLGIRPEWRVEDAGFVSSIDRDVLVFSRGPGILDYLRDGHPSVVRARPGVRVEMVGPEPSPEVARAAREAGVRYLGFVDDISAVIRSSAVLVAPSQQRCGVSNRAMAAMQAGVAVVGGQCVINLPGSVPGRDYLIGYTPQAIAASICQVLTDDQLRLRLGMAGNRYARGLDGASEVAGLYWKNVTDWTLKLGQYA